MHSTSVARIALAAMLSTLASAMPHPGYVGFPLSNSTSSAAATSDMLPSSTGSTFTHPTLPSGTGVSFTHSQPISTGVSSPIGTGSGSQVSDVKPTGTGTGGSTDVSPPGPGYSGPVTTYTTDITYTQTYTLTSTVSRLPTFDGTSIVSSIASIFTTEIPAVVTTIITAGCDSHTCYGVTSGPAGPAQTAAPTGSPITTWTETLTLTDVNSSTRYTTVTLTGFASSSVPIGVESVVPSTSVLTTTFPAAITSAPGVGACGITTVFQPTTVYVTVQATAASSAGSPGSRSGSDSPSSGGTSGGHGTGCVPGVPCHSGGSWNGTVSTSAAGTGTGVYSTVYLPTGTGFILPTGM